MSFKVCVSLLIFCLFDLSISMSGMLKSPTIIMLPFQFCLLSILLTQAKWTVLIWTFWLLISITCRPLFLPFWLKCPPFIFAFWDPTHYSKFNRDAISFRDYFLIPLIWLSVSSETEIITWGRWRRNRMGRPLSPLQTHRKNIWMLSKLHKTTSDH